MMEVSPPRPADNTLILIAEDDADIAQILTAYLDREGYRTAAIAHELRTPLTVLSGRLHGIRDGVFEPGGATRLRA